MKNLLILSLLLVFPGWVQSQWTFTNMPNPVDQMGAAALESDHTFWFAGGGDDINLPITDVVIYHAETGVWTNKNLSIARKFPAGIGVGDLMFFAGGLLGNNQPTDRVDIWNNQTSQAYTAQLSEPRYLMSAVAAEGKVLFAGGIDFGTGTYFDDVDIYDMNTQTWSTTTLSIPRVGMGAVVLETSNGTIAMFAGGTTEPGATTDRIDVYHFNTGTWSTKTLPTSRGLLGAATAGGKAFFAGGITSSNVPTSIVDVYDPQTDSWTQTSLSQARALPNYGVSACDKVVFAGGGSINLNTYFWDNASDVIDIYDVTTGTWSTESLPEAVVNHAMASDGKYMVIAGGAGGTDLQVVMDDVTIYTCPSSSVFNPFPYIQPLRLHPNPTTGFVFVETQSDETIQLVRLINMRGDVVFTREWNVSNNPLQLPANLPSGVYTLVVGRETGRLVVE